MPETIAKEIVFRITQLFFDEGKKVTQIRDTVNRELKPDPRLTREAVYPLLARAKADGYVRVIPPVHEQLAEEIVNRFGCERGSISVVPTLEPRFNYLVAEVAAGLVLDILRRLKKGGQNEIGLGIGPGRATLDFARHLGELLNTELGLPQINLHAIGAGCPTEWPEYASTSFFNLFPRHLVSRRFGLFAETMVPTKEYQEIIKRAWLDDAFQQRKDISIVVTSMGDMYDEHDLFTAFLKKANYNIKQLQKRGWLGNVQYRPYTSKGPVPQSQQPWRSVTLFELEDFEVMARTKNKHVVLVARQCAQCGRTRAPALKPLLEVPALRVWSEIVMDAATATELLDAPVS